MNPSFRLHRGLGAAAVLACMIATVGAAPIFTESFNSYSGNQNSTRNYSGAKSKPNKS